MPVVDRLEDQFGDQVEFVHLNVDAAHARDRLAEFGVRGRSQYLLVTTNGEVLNHWFGPIGHLEEAMAAEITTAIGGTP